MGLSTVSKTDKILLLGIILAPMTGFRIAKVGPAELLVFLWCILNIKNIVKIKIINYNFKFWLVFIFLIILGGSYGMIFYPEQVIATDVFTWIYLMFINLGIYQVFRNRGYEYSNSFLKQLVILGTIWYIFLYIYSLFISDSFFGAPLWYLGVRFSGGATNPHQIAVLLGAFTPLTIKYIKSSTKRFNKLLYIILFIACIFLGYETKSATLQLSIVLSLSLLLILKFLKVFQSKKTMVNVLLLIIVLLSIILLLNSNFFINKFITWVASDPNGLGRFDLFSTIYDTLGKNWLFGLGPGKHAFYGTAEYHNTYLEILAMGGILAVINFLIYSVRVFKVYSIDIYFFSSALALYFYGLAGFSMRRLIYWAIIALMLAIAEQKRCEVIIKDNG